MRLCTDCAKDKCQSVIRAEYELKGSTLCFGVHPPDECGDEFRICPLRESIDPELGYGENLPDQDFFWDFNYEDLQVIKIGIAELEKFRLFNSNST